ncbi:class I SAM-dependent methyltransferase [Acetobacteraceae bacterium]|nr:class I SAM-dependent methyltransferase [Acetobacteraceae bacterium]
MCGVTQKNAKTNPLPQETSREFWERRYQSAGFSAEMSIRPPRPRLKEFLEKLHLPQGLALDLGCGRGEDAIWLAQQGWAVVGVDVSQAALQQGRLLAEHAGEEISKRIEFSCCDLDQTFPAGKYDLISAQFFESPVPFGRNRILKKAANYVNLNGILLITSHVSRPPWSWPMRFVPPAPEAALAALNLREEEWSKICVADLSRVATGPEGQKAIVKDGVICLRRRQ